MGARRPVGPSNAVLILDLDDVARLALAQRRAAFVRGHLVDLAVVALPLLRPLRLLRLLILLGVLNRYAGGPLRGTVAVDVVGATSIVLFVASLAMLDNERGAKGANITNHPDALWWAATTVGYGDRYPTTGTGRLIGAALMLCGTAPLGVVTATLASWLVQQVAEVEEASQAATRRDVEALTAQVRARQSAQPTVATYAGAFPPGVVDSLCKVCAHGNGPVAAKAADRGGLGIARDVRAGVPATFGAPFLRPTRTDVPRVRLRHQLGGGM